MIGNFYQALEKLLWQANASIIRFRLRICSVSC